MWHKVNLKLLAGEASLRDRTLQLVSKPLEVRDGRLEVRCRELVPYQLLQLPGVATWTVRLVPIQNHRPRLLPFAYGNGPHQLRSLLV